MENQEIKYRIKGIEIISKYMAPMPVENFNNKALFNINVEIRVKAQDKLVIPFVSIEIKDETGTVEFGNIKLACLFEIEDFENVIKLNEAQLYHIPENLEVPIRFISISTTRGVLFGEFKGTYLQNIILPVVNMDTFKKQEVDKVN